MSDNGKQVLHVHFAPQRPATMTSTEPPLIGALVQGGRSSCVKSAWETVGFKLAMQFSMRQRFMGGQGPMLATSAESTMLSTAPVSNYDRFTHMSSCILDH